MKNVLNEGNNFISSSGSGTVISSGSDLLTSYGSSSGSTSQKVKVLTVPVPQHCSKGLCNVDRSKCSSGLATVQYFIIFLTPESGYGHEVKT
jgi:hypothetical protein